MRKFCLLFTLLSGFFIGKSQQAATITVTNPTNLERKDELVILSRGFLIKKLGSLPTKSYLQVTAGKQPVVVQFDDLNGDGIWDESVFLHSFPPMGRAVFFIVASAKPPAIKVVVRAHVRQMHKLPDESFGPSLLRDTMPYNNQPTDFSKQKLPPYLTEGPGWENDKVGFRKYFDVRNANDIWGKVTPRMMLDEVGVDPTKIYHHFDSTWGMDILKVGKSLGAGGLALQMQVDGKDTLVRFGTNVQQTTYEQVADGPVRAIFRIKYKGWKVGSLPPIEATQEISIWGGQCFYQNKVTVTNAPPSAKLVTGLNNFYVKAADTLQSTTAKVLYTYGRQSENGDNLGMAVLVPAGYFAGYCQTPDAASEVLNTFTISEMLSQQKPVMYRFYVGWEKSDSQFAGEVGFRRFLKDEILKGDIPLLVR